MADKGADPTVQVAMLAELGLMTAGLLHELRDPLFALKGQLQLLRSRGHSELATLDTPLADIEALVDFYGSFGQGMSEPMRIDLGSEVRHALTALGAAARRRRVRLTVDLGPAPVPVRVRPVAVRQVLVNLVRNALDAVEGRHSPQVWVHTRVEDGWVHLDVQDNGPGVPEHVRARAFEPWVSTKGDRGSGLGLYLTRSLLVEAGGQIRIDEREGGGTVVRGSFPVCSDPV
ncbi:MAG: sensor histidine kinase [Myxococcota bacterium]